MSAESVAVEHYSKKFGSSPEKAFIHFAKELGELARGIEKNQPEVARLEITEMAALLFFFASLYSFDLLKNVEELYKKKLEQK